MHSAGGTQIVQTTETKLPFMAPKFVTKDTPDPRKFNMGDPVDIDKRVIIAEPKRKLGTVHESDAKAMAEWCQPLTEDADRAIRLEQYKDDIDEAISLLEKAHSSKHNFDSHMHELGKFCY